MPRTPSTFDPFSAVAEPKRRQVLEALRGRELSVSQVVASLGWRQPTVSKHLGVLRQVGLVRQRRVGRQRLYRLEARQLKPIYDWVSPFEEFWTESFGRLDEVLEELQTKET
jgi:DNA-binding transcriptional ArsR family regulator